MKKLFVTLIALSAAVTAFAQGGNTRDGGPEGDYKSLWELVSKQEKKNDGFNLYFNFAGSFQESLNPFASSFKAKQLRIEVKGTFGKHLSYRYRQRLNKARADQDDNLAKSIDVMMLGWKFNDHWAVNLGKMCQIWGGFEFDENPMFIYQYSDMLDYMDNFMTGGMVSWFPVPSQEIAFMVTNAYTSRREYKGYTPSAHPLTYILNWNGSMFGGLLNTRWAAGIQTEAQHKYSYMVTLGQQLALPKFQLYVDYMGEYDQLDRLGIVTEDIGVTENVRYHSLIAKANWQFLPKWNLMGKGMYELATVADKPNLALYRQSIGWVGSIEYYPWKEQDLRFFLAYVGRDHHFTKASGIAAANGTTHRIEIGFMYRIKAY